MSVSQAEARCWEHNDGFPVLQGENAAGIYRTSTQVVRLKKSVLQRSVAIHSDSSLHTVKSHHPSETDMNVNSVDF